MSHRLIDTTPIADFAVVTPTDGLVLPRFRALWVGGAGNVAIRTLRGTTVTISGVVAGTLIPVYGDIVLATGTTATLILAGR